MTALNLDQLAPREVLHWFRALSEIPHGSGNSRAISDFCVDFAKARGLEHYRDALNNVIIISPATPGYEDAPPVIVQGHLDMVCVTAPGCDKDMRTEGLTLASDGEWLWAEGTSLGADDGIAVAMALAVLDDPTIPRPRLEAVFTVDEEVGMLGAAALDASPLCGRTVLNLDSEVEGIFTVACAGGVRADVRYHFTAAPADGLRCALTLSGLLGGHSGGEINTGRANANRETARIVRTLADTASLQLIALRGGVADNAIPARCTAQFLADAESLGALQNAVADLTRELRTQYPVESGLTLTLSAEEPAQRCAALSTEDTRALCDAVCAYPNGVQSMSRAIPGLVQTSLNLGMLSLTGGNALLRFLLRSGDAGEKQALADRLSALAAQSGGSIAFSGDYPPWEYREDSPLRERMTALYRAQYGCEPTLEIIHMGVECGILAQKLPGMDCVSFGPDLENIHTAEERMNLASVQRVWEFLKTLLRESR